MVSVSWMWFPFCIEIHMEDIYSIYLLKLYICTTCINHLKIMSTTLLSLNSLFFFLFIAPRNSPKMAMFLIYNIKNCSPHNIPFLSPHLVEMFLLNCTSLWWLCLLQEHENSPIWDCSLLWRALCITGTLSSLWAPTGNTALCSQLKQNKDFIFGYASAYQAKIVL